MSQTNGRMIIVGFLQNQWFNDPERMKMLLEERYMGDREKFIRHFLFYNCVTGRRLKQYLGEHWCEDIIWEETSLEMGATPSASYPPDLLHIGRVIRKHHPTHVIAFGAIAQKGLKQLNGRMNFRLTKPSTGPYREPNKPRYKVYNAPHPASRYPDLDYRLQSVAMYLQEEKKRAKL